MSVYYNSVGEGWFKKKDEVVNEANNEKENDNFINKLMVKFPTTSLQILFEIMQKIEKNHEWNEDLEDDLLRIYNILKNRKVVNKLEEIEKDIKNYLQIK